MDTFNNVDLLNSYNELEDMDVFYDSDDTSDSADVPETIYDFADGFVVMLNKFGHVDLDYWASICDTTPARLIKMYEGKLIWLDPAQFMLNHNHMQGWLTKSEYIRGNIVKKCDMAIRLNKEYKGLFKANIDILRENLPDKVDPYDIHISFSATWLSDILKADFLYKTLDLLTKPVVHYEPYTGKYIVKYFVYPDFVTNFYTYGTKRMSAQKIVDNLLNGRPIKVYDQIPRDDREGTRSVLNQQETLAAQEKMKDLLDAWNKFVHSSVGIEEAIQEMYSENYGYTISSFDGDFLQLADMNPNVTLYPHQKNAIAHILFSPSVLLAHNVGAGKTYEYCAGVHELIRIGLGKKALIVVPKSTLEAASEAYKYLYPQDDVLVVHSTKEFSVANRVDTLKRMATDAYSVIFMPDSSFDMLTLSKELIFKQREDEISMCKQKIQQTKSAPVKGKLESQLRRLKKEQEKFIKNYKESNTAVFDKLGIDILVVDECHHYKNITLDDFACENVVGLHSKGSKKADNMLEKVDYIRNHNGRVIFATGTCLCNSLADLYVMQRYLQPEELKICDIYHFPNWIGSFAEQEHSFEIDVDSSNFRFTTRFCKFHNLPELMGMFSEVCDFYVGDDEAVNLPKFNGYIDVVVPKSAPLRDYIASLAERTDAIRHRYISAKEDNLLKITVEGRKAALDIRLVMDGIDTSKLPLKVKYCADKMAEIYHTHKEATQIAFCDISTPKDGFNIYDELKCELVERGVKPEEIMFIHDADTDAKRAKAEKLFNQGIVRILVGSTSKLGTGSNVQERLYAIHHLDVPWRPADMVQREGRILRQGNTNEEVFIYRYITEASFDAYTYQILENKQKFISMFLSGSLSALHRAEEDCADTVLTFAEVKALAIGNPLIKERVLVSNELEHAKINQRQKRKELKTLEEHLNVLPRMIQKRIQLIETTTYDQTFYSHRKEQISREERIKFGEELLYALWHQEMEEADEQVFDVWQGFEIILPANARREKPYVIIKGKSGGTYRVLMDTDKALGCTQRLDYVLNHLDELLEEHKHTLDDLYKQKSEAEDILELGNAYDIEVQALTDKLRSIDEKLKEEKVS